MKFVHQIWTQRQEIDDINQLVSNFGFSFCLVNYVGVLEAHRTICQFPVGVSMDQFHVIFFDVFGVVGALLTVVSD